MSEFNGRDLQTLDRRILSEMCSYFTENPSATNALTSYVKTRLPEIPAAQFNAIVERLDQLAYIELDVNSPDLFVVKYKGWIVGNDKDGDAVSASTSLADGLVASDAVEAEVIPAADRFVPLNHNSGAFADAASALERLEDTVRSSNGLSVTQEERLAVVSEVRSLRALLDAPTVRVRAIWEAVRGSGVIAWLAKQSAEAVVQAAVIAAATTLLVLVGLH